MKQIYYSILLLLLHSNLIAQYRHNVSPNDSKHRYEYAAEDCQKKAELVFEGRLIAIRSYIFNGKDLKNNPKKILLSSAVIRVEKIFRGKLVLGLIELISNVSPYISFEEGDPIQPYIKMQDTCSQIFFCKKSTSFTHDLNSIGYTFNSNEIICNYFDDPDYIIPRYEIHNNNCIYSETRGIHGFDSTFISKASLYNYLRKQYNLSIPKRYTEPNDTIQSPAYNEYVSWYKKVKLHIKEPTDSERIVIAARIKKIQIDSLDSINSLTKIKQQKIVYDNLLKKDKRPGRYQYHWDEKSRKYVGHIINPSHKKKQSTKIK